MFYSASTSRWKVFNDKRLTMCDIGAYCVIVEYAIGERFSMVEFESFIAKYDDAQQDRIRVSIGRLVEAGHIEIKEGQ